MNRVIKYAQQTFLAIKNPYESVEKVFPQAIYKTEVFEETHYVGVKNVSQIPKSILKKLNSYGYVLHTLDKASVNGRAVDIKLINPITGGKMTGSSSGTALNVFLGINDLGIGTDGGGSVLAPAMSLQCYGFISPLLEKEHMQQYSKRSTDGLVFTPSLGFICREFKVIKDSVRICLNLDMESEEGQVQVLCSNEVHQRLPEKEMLDLKIIEFPAFNTKREEMIEFLRQYLCDCDVLVHYERKIDVYGLGDSILGHFDRETEEMQLKSGKFLIRVANMAGATALCIPDTALASGFVLLCESKPDKIKKLLQFAEAFAEIKDELLERYFRNVDAYFPYGAFEDEVMES